jgi:hypothetical protein
MKHRILPILVAAGFMTIGASPALADAGAPGTTFPEQPGTHGQTACTAVTTNPGTGVGGAAMPSPTAAAIVTGLLQDACFGG